MDDETSRVTPRHEQGDSLLDPSFISRAELERWKCSDLSEWLANHGGKKTGKKDALVNRICQIMKDGPQYVFVYITIKVN